MNREDKRGVASHVKLDGHSCSQVRWSRARRRPEKTRTPGSTHSTDVFSSGHMTRRFACHLSPTLVPIEFRAPSASSASSCPPPLDLPTDSAGPRSSGTTLPRGSPASLNTFSSTRWACVTTRYRLRRSSRSIPTAMSWRAMAWSRERDSSSTARCTKPDRTCMRACIRTLTTASQYPP